jgi:hypothetical protein
LADEVHPNDRGKQLIAEFFNRYFDGLVTKYNGEQASDVKTLAPTPAERASGNETVHLEGSRLELVGNKPLPAWPTVTIDGQSPASFDGCYQITRPSALETIPDWPIIRRITLMHDHVVEDWTATLTDFRRIRRISPSPCRPQNQASREVATPASASSRTTEPWQSTPTIGWSSEPGIRRI